MNAVDVLIAHQRLEPGWCICGWIEAGGSHAEHVFDTLYVRAPGDGPHLLIRDTGEMERCC